MRRVLPWLVAFVVLIASGGGAVVALNATAFGAGDFVRVYLDALARGDADGALALPGVTAAGDDALLLADDALVGVSDLHQVSDIDRGGGRHSIAFSWDSPGGSGTSTFEVERVGTRFGLFAEWGFAVSPVATLSLSTETDPRFTVNQLAAEPATASAAPVDYAVFVPGSYELGHRSAYLAATTRHVLAAEVGQTIEAAVDAEPTAAFTDAVAEQVHTLLQTCAAQQVLFPTGCPFGEEITNRVVSDPVWTVVADPEIRLEPGETFASWAVGPAPGTAHLTVDVKSLFDGKVSTFDEDVPFDATYLVTLARTATGGDTAIVVNNAD